MLRFLKLHEVILVIIDIKTFCNFLQDYYRYQKSTFGIWLKLTLYHLHILTSIYTKELGIFDKRLPDKNCGNNCVVARKEGSVAI